MTVYSLKPSSADLPSIVTLVNDVNEEQKKKKNQDVFEIYFLRFGVFKPVTVFRLQSRAYDGEETVFVFEQ
jgi:hypothetical protein